MHYYRGETDIWEGRRPSASSNQNSNTRETYQTGRSHSSSIEQATQVTGAKSDNHKPRKRRNEGECR